MDLDSEQRDCLYRTADVREVMISGKVANEIRPEISL